MRSHHRITGRSVAITLLILVLFNPGTGKSADWPMWRYDAEHRAASPEQLPDILVPQWTLKFSPREQVWDDPLNHDLMPYDRVFEPIVLGHRMFVTFNDSDKVSAFNTANGKELWRFYTDGPVRLPPVGHDNKIYVTSDDGHLYCLAAETGRLRWKFRGGPSPLKVLGNKRVISAWPARGGPVIRDGSIYFTASIWPFMGTFIYSLDAKTGDVNWVNDSTGAQYIKQPHSAPSFAGVAPQGTLVATDEFLLVPGGRSVPAAFDRATGKFVHFEINAGGKGNGGSFVIANGEEFFVHTRRRGVRGYALTTGKKSSFTCNEPVLTRDHLYTATAKDIQILDSRKKKIWDIAADGTGDLIKSGNRLYAAGTNSLSAIDLSAGGSKGTVAWTRKVNGSIQRLLAANEKLFAVTLDGRIMAFGGGNSSDRTIVPLKRKLNTTTRAAAFLQQTRAKDGYCLWYGAKDLPLVESVLTHSDLRIVVVDPDQTKVDQLRRHFDTADLYGNRISVHQGTPETFQAPPYIAHLVHVETELSDAALAKLYESVRPYGGALSLSMTSLGQLDRANLDRAIIHDHKSRIVVFREGALPNSDDWTHQYGDIANSVKSDDSRLKLPLGILWFGGSSNMDVLPRHGHGPPEQVIGGRMFIEGINSLSCRDVYTGRVLWIRRFEDLGTFGIYYNETYKNTPLNPSYNQKHIPGANGRGANYVATEDAVYLAIGSNCLVLDPQTGKTRRTVRLNKGSGQSQAPQWGFIGIYEDILLAGNGFANYSQRYAAGNKPVKPTIEDYSASAGLVAFDRHSGRRLWDIPARHSFLHNGIIAGADRVYLLDKLPKSAEDKLKRRGRGVPDDYRIVALNVRSGSKLWETDKDIFGTWLSYSTQHDILLQAGAKASDRLRDEVGDGMITYRGKSGKIVWQRRDLRYSGPCILHNNLIIANANQHSNRKGIGETSTVFSLLDGSDQNILNPISGRMEPWRIARGKGCNSIIACENFLTFRDGAASYYDLENRNGIGSFGGFKSGCTANLVVANGVLNAPDYTRTCSCSYQNQTSLALIHMPDVELWTSSLLGDDKGTDSINRIGINFGAPGDRQSDDGTMWLDYPSVGGRSPLIDIKIAGEGLDYFRQHTSTILDSELPWVHASGARNVQTILIRPETEDPTRDTPGAISADQRSDTAEESANGKISLASSDLEMTQEGSRQTVGIHFRKIPLGRGTVVPPSFIQFTVDETGSAPTRLTIRAEAVDNAKEFTTKARDISSRDLTRASISWSPKPWTKVGGKQTSPDVSKLITEIINRPGWKPGNAIAFVITGTGKRVARAGGNGAPQLSLRLTSAERPKPSLAAKTYSVLLYFNEPDSLKPGDRVFDIALQDRTLERTIDLSKATGRNRGLVKRYAGIRIADVLKVELKKSPGSSQPPVLSGVELIAE